MRTIPNTNPSAAADEAIKSSARAKAFLRRLVLDEVYADESDDVVAHATQALEEIFWAGVQYAQQTRATTERKKNALAVVEGLDRQAWEQWVEYRRELGKRPYKTNRVAEWLGGFHPTTQRQIVRQSIEKEWHGLFPLKETPKGVAPAEEAEYL